MIDLALGGTCASFGFVDLIEYAAIGELDRLDLGPAAEVLDVQKRIFGSATGPFAAAAGSRTR